MSRKLDPRLQMIASSVPRSSCVADIGTDHAYLPVYLITHDICQRAYATDISPASCRKAAANIAKAGLCEKITVICGNGLSGFSPGTADCIVIAGMGGRNMISILAGAAWLRGRDPACRLVLSPNTNAAELREWLCLHGFSLLSERAAIGDQNRVYTVMSAAYTGKINRDRGFYHTGLLPQAADEAARLCLRREHRRLINQAKRFSHRKETAAYEETLRLAETVGRVMK